MAKEIRVIRYHPELQETWDTFIRQSVNGTMLSTMRFLSYHSPEQFRDHSLIVTQGDRWVAVLPACEQSRNGIREWNSHPGCTYGGLLAPPQMKTALAQGIVREIVTYTRQAGFERLIISPPPDLYHRAPCQQIDFVFQMAGFEHRFIGLSTCVNVGTDAEDEFYFTLGSNCARSVRKAKRAGIRVDETDDFESFWEILTENLRAHGVSPVHSVEEIRDLHGRFPKRIRLFASFLDGRMLSGTVLFLATETVAHTQYLASRAEYQQYRPMNLLIWRIMQWVREQGMTWLNFGVSTESEGTGVNWGLLRFKESFGGTGVVHHRYQLDLQE